MEYVIIFLLFGGPVLIFIISNIHDKKQKVKYKNGELSEYEEQKYLEKQKAIQDQQDAIKHIETKGVAHYMKTKNMNDEELEQLRKSETIVKTMIVASETSDRQKFGSSVARGAIGGLALGGIGALAGVASGKHKTSSTTTFLIEYEDGHREVKEVFTNSDSFKELCKYLDM